MSPALRKLLAILGGLLIAGGITWYPWTYWDHFTGSASSVYGMSAVIWAPAALIIGLMAGTAFAVVLWPRRLRRGPEPEPALKPAPPKDHFEA